MKFQIVYLFINHSLQIKTKTFDQITLNQNNILKGDSESANKCCSFSELLLQIGLNKCE